MKKTFLILLASGATLVALAADQPPTTGNRQGGNWGGGQGGQGGGWTGGQRFGGTTGFQTRSGIAGFDTQQQQLFQEALQKDSDKLRALEEKLRVAQKDLLQAAMEVNYDEKAVRVKAEAVAKIQVEITLLRAGALATVAPTMKPAQKEQLTDSPSSLSLLSSGGSGVVMSGGMSRRSFSNSPGGATPGAAPNNGFPNSGRDQAPRDR